MARKARLLPDETLLAEASAGWGGADRFALTDKRLHHVHAGFLGTVQRSHDLANLQSIEAKKTWSPGPTVVAVGTLLVAVLSPLMFGPNASGGATSGAAFLFGLLFLSVARQPLVVIRTDLEHLRIRAAGLRWGPLRRLVEQAQAEKSRAAAMTAAPGRGPTFQPALGARGPKRDPTLELQSLESLRQQGLISAKDFEARRRDLLEQR